MKKDLLARYEAWGFPQKETISFDKTLRISTLRRSEKTICNSLKGKNVKLTAISFLNTGYSYVCNFPLASSLEFLTGDIYIQEAPAQFVGNTIQNIILDKKYDTKTIRILDMCAAPGGKTTHIANILQNKGTIIACDIDSKRIEKLCFNIERMGATNIIVYNAKKTPYKDLGTFDIVLLDAPCSGNYTDSKTWPETRTIEDFLNRQNIQKKLLTEAKTLLNDTGVLVYSTCSLEKEENEAVVEYGIEHAGLIVIPQISPAHTGLTDQTKGCIRFWPSQDKQPGFFIAVLEKKQ